MAYNPTNWQNLPNTNTAITATRLNNIEQGIYKNNGNISTDEYDSTATYNVGDYCIYNNYLYRCISAVTVAGAFNAGNWERTSITKELQEYRQTIDEPLFTWNNSILAAKPSVHYYQGMMFVYGELKTNVNGVGTQVINLSNYKSRLKLICPINSYNRCDGESVIEANDTKISVNISISTGNGKFYMVFPVEPI